MKQLCKGNVFSVDGVRAFQKIKEDMVTELGAWFREVAANAIDAQHGMVDAPPIEIALRKLEDGGELIVTDAGEGMDNEHILAFHYMGRTTKRGASAADDGVIGRFGLGFISVFANRNAVRNVTIDTRTPGGNPRRIEIQNPDENTIPNWRELPPENHAPLHGTRFKFQLAEQGFAKIESQITAFCAQTIVPIRRGERIYLRTPHDLVAKDGDHITEAANADRSVQVWCAIRTTSYGTTDFARIYLRNMPAEMGSAHLMFGNGGDKMAQNCYGRPYLPSESLVITSKIGEPTLARDSLLRNAQFEQIKSVVNAARAQAVDDILSKLIKVSKNIITNTYLANLYTLQSHLAAHLEERELPVTIAPAVKAVAQYPFFEVHDSTRQLSLEQLYNMRSKRHAVFLHACGIDVASQFIHTSPCTLKESILFNTVFGGHTKWLCAGLLNDVFGCSKGAEPRPSLYAMEDVLGRATLAAQLEEKGVISRQDYRVEQAEIDDPKMQAWFDAVKTTLNQSWFRSALSTYDDIRTLRLLPIKIAAKTTITEILAMQLNVQGSEPDTVTIGVRIDSEAARILAAAGTGRETLLPTVVQIASCISRHHFGRFILNQENISELACTQELMIETIGLEDRVIHRALRYLSGLEEETGAGGKGCIVL